MTSQRATRRRQRGCKNSPFVHMDVLLGQIVDINIIFLHLYLSAQFATLYVPKTLFFIASNGLDSIKGTCLCAAA